MPSSALKQVLVQFHMADGAGIVPTEGSTPEAGMAHPRAKRVLWDALALGASHVLFRFPENAERPPIPQAFIFDFSESPIAPGEEAEIQRKVWNTGLVPLIFVIQSDRVDIINALEKPELKDGVVQPLTPVAQLQLASTISKTIRKRNEKVALRFSGDRFANGTFWDDPENRSLLADSTAQKTLLQEMRTAHKAIEAHKILTPDLTRRFFILCLMVKYLEDRKILHEDYFKGFLMEATSFEDLLRRRDNEYAALRICLKNLAIRFNGDVFSLTDQEEMAIVSADLTPYAEFVQGQLVGPQFHLWKLYSFDYLPVELISYIYEDFLRDNNEAVYTPHTLVDLLLDEIMPTKTIPADYRILDPACGSGVFLVGAFRRLVEAYLADHPKLGPGQVPGEKLCDMLVNNIRGVDIDPIAVELTSFSLCVALCSELSPESARADMKFPTLAGRIANGTINEIRSIRECDFFALTEKADDEPGSFDLIIGNPPFGSNEKDNLAAKVALNTKGPLVPFPKLPDKQLCYLFLRDAPKLLKEGGVGCLLQKDGFLYNGGVLEFRAAFLKNYEVPQIFDFVSVRGMFTGRKVSSATTEGEEEKSDEAHTVDVKAVAVFFRRPVADTPLAEKPILHATFRKLFAVGRRRGFELDAYDYHWVSLKLAIEEPRVWKANLLGGGRLLSTYRAFANDHVRNIGTYIAANGRTPALVESDYNKPKDAAAKKEKDESKWICSEGFIAGAESAKPLSEKIAMPSHFLETKGLTLEGVDKSAIAPLKVKRYSSTRDVRLYDPPHLLVKEHESLPFALRRTGENTLGFKHKIVGIKCTEEDETELSLLAEYLGANRSGLQFFLSFSSQYLINKQSAILKEDIMDLPFPENGKLEFRGVEEWLVGDVIDRQIRFIKIGANAESSLFKPTTGAQLTEYENAFLQVLRSVYPEARYAERHEFTTAHCIAFSFGDKPRAPFGDATQLESHLNELLLTQKGKALRIHRIVRLFDTDTLYFVKPKAYRFWTRSIAVRDADEAFASLVEQGF